MHAEHTPINIEGCQEIRIGRSIVKINYFKRLEKYLIDPRRMPGIGRIRKALMQTATAMCSQRMKCHRAAPLPATAVWCKSGCRQDAELVGEVIKHARSLH